MLNRKKSESIYSNKLSYFGSIGLLYNLICIIKTVIESKIYLFKHTGITRSMAFWPDLQSIVAHLFNALIRLVFFNSLLAFVKWLKLMRPLRNSFEFVNCSLIILMQHSKFSHFQLFSMVPQVWSNLKNRLWRKLPTVIQLSYFNGCLTFECNKISLAIVSPLSPFETNQDSI